jgi:hypothetical protein
MVVWPTVMQPVVLFRQHFTDVEDAPQMDERDVIHRDFNLLWMEIFAGQETAPARRSTCRHRLVCAVVEISRGDYRGRPLNGPPVKGAGMALTLCILRGPQRQYATVLRLRMQRDPPSRVFRPVHSSGPRRPMTTDSQLQGLE